MKEGGERAARSASADRGRKGQGLDEDLGLWPPVLLCLLTHIYTCTQT